MNESPKTSKTFGKIPVFSKEECEKVLRSVEKLSHLWVQRGPDFGLHHFFFTIGAATYIDYATSRDSYEARVAESAAEMRDELGWMYDKIQSALEPLIGCSIISSKLGPPGFHVFSRRGMKGVPGDPEVRKMMIRSLSASKHYDIQHLYHKEHFESFPHLTLAEHFRLQYQFRYLLCPAV